MSVPQVMRTLANAAAVRAAERESMRWQGELTFTVAQYTSVLCQVVFDRELPQAPLVLYSIQCEPNKGAITNSYITERTTKGFHVLLENNGVGDASGVLIYLAFVRSP